MKRFPATLLALALLAVSCGDGDDPADGDVVVIRGGERLAWDQAAPSFAILQRYTFILYVDNSPTPFGEVSCGAGAAGAAAFVCSGRIPALPRGTHDLQVAAVLDGAESARSAPLRVRIESSSTSSSIPRGESGRPSSPVACLDAGVDDCYRVHEVARDLGAIQDLVAVQDRRVFLIEDARHVRVASDDGLAAEAALSVDAATTTLVSLAVGPDFLATRHVYVGSVDRRADGRREFVVTRYRELLNTLGEGAAIVAGLQVAGTPRVPIAVDAQRHLYVALPAAGAVLAGRSAFAYSGAVLRFSADGSTPSGQSTPVVAAGYARPLSLLFDASGHRLWLAGTGGPRRERVAVIDTLKELVREQTPGIEMITSNVAAIEWLTLHHDAALIVSEAGEIYRGDESSDRFRRIATGLAWVDRLVLDGKGAGHAVVRSGDSSVGQPRALLRLGRLRSSDVPTSSPAPR